MQEFFEKDFYEKLAYNLCHFKYKKYCKSLLNIYSKALNNKKSEYPPCQLLDFENFQNTISNTIELTPLLATEIKIYSLLIEIAKKYSYITHDFYLNVVEKIFLRLLLSKKIKINPSNSKYFQWLFIQKLLEACIPDLEKLSRETGKYMDTLQIILKEKEKSKINDTCIKKAHNALSDIELTKWYKCRSIYQDAVSSCKILKFLIKARINKWNKEEALSNRQHLSASEFEYSLLGIIIEKIDNSSDFWYEELMNLLFDNYKGLYNVLLEDLAINNEEKLIKKFKNINKSSFALEACRDKCSITKGLTDKAILNNLSSIELKYKSESFKYYEPKEQVKYEIETLNYYEKLEILFLTLNKCFYKYIHNPIENKYELESRIMALKSLI